MILVSLICNPSTSALGVRFPMGLLRHRMRLVILLDKAQNNNQQLRARLPTICRGWIPAPPEEETHSQTGLQVQSDTVSQLERVTCELRENIEHERIRRSVLVDNVTRLFSERERDR
uniref:Uncharacterized protein n=1 Tax=Hyaloperonospora arabidopsidis (strain Emoy2) TaxID=559515 RepID=M4BAE3_HYAAE